MSNGALTENTRHDRAQAGTVYFALRVGDIRVQAKSVQKSKSEVVTFSTNYLLTHKISRPMYIWSVYPRFYDDKIIWSNTWASACIPFLSIYIVLQSLCAYFFNKKKKSRKAVSPNLLYPKSNDRPQNGSCRICYYKSEWT